jgi:hypothetical protein
MLWARLVRAGLARAGLVWSWLVRVGLVGPVLLGPVLLGDDWLRAGCAGGVRADRAGPIDRAGTLLLVLGTSPGSGRRLVSRTRHRHRGLRARARLAAGSLRRGTLRWRLCPRRVRHGGRLAAGTLRCDPGCRAGTRSGRQTQGTRRRLQRGIRGAAIAGSTRGRHGAGSASRDPTGARAGIVCAGVFRGGAVKAGLATRRGSSAGTTAGGRRCTRLGCSAGTRNRGRNGGTACVRGCARAPGDRRGAGASRRDRTAGSGPAGSSGLARRRGPTDGRSGGGTRSGNRGGSSA